MVKYPTEDKLFFFLIKLILFNNLTIKTFFVFWFLSDVHTDSECEKTTKLSGSFSVMMFKSKSMVIDSTLKNRGFVR